MTSGLWVKQVDYPNFLGITMLAILMNEDYNKYYDWKSNLVLFDVIRSRLNSLSSKLKYSANLVTLISGCLEKGEE